MTVIDPKIISLIIQEEERKKKIEKSEQYRENAVIHIEFPQEDLRYTEEDEEEQTRGVIVIDI